METESIIAGLFLLILGGLNVVRPDILIRFNVWTQKAVMGAKYEPSERTYFVTRIIGVILVIFGLLAITGIIK